MLIFGVKFSDVWGTLHTNTLFGEGPIRFINFLEKRLGAKFVYDTRDIPYGKTELIDLFEIAQTLRAAGVIHDVTPVQTRTDEPPFKQWRVECGTHDKHIAGGMAITNQRDALIPALAEAVERYLWMTATDYFESVTYATEGEISKKGAHIGIDQFVGFTQQQRSTNTHLTITPESQFNWIKGFSHTQKKQVFIPAQVISGVRQQHEPLILTPITTGLATGPTKEFALLNGALEILERDAFMITWMNQLTPPQIDIHELAKGDNELQKVIDDCLRYRLKLQSVLLPTDAPAYAVCSIVTDQSGHVPEVSIGLKAHRNIVSAVKGSLLEALRIRQTIRYNNEKSPLKDDVKTEDIVHLERAQYWGRKGSAEKLSFLTSGAIKNIEPQKWDTDTVEEHWNRIVEWCKKEGHHCVSVEVGKSKKNVSPWHIYMLSMPAMQPMHQTERLIYLGGERLKSVPVQFGYTPAPTPFTDEPHPFA